MSQDGCLPPGRRFLALNGEPVNWQRFDPCAHIDYISLNELIAQNNLRLAESIARNQPADRPIPVSASAESDARHAFYVAQHVRTIDPRHLSKDLDVDSQEAALSDFAKRRTEQGSRNRHTFFTAVNCTIDYEEFVRDEALQIEAVEWLKSLKKTIPVPESAQNDRELNDMIKVYPILGPILDTMNSDIGTQGTSSGSNSISGARDNEDLNSIYSQASALESTRHATPPLNASEFGTNNGSEILNAPTPRNVKLQSPLLPVINNSGSYSAVAPKAVMAPHGPPVLQYASYGGTASHARNFTGLGVPSSSSDNDKIVTAASGQNVLFSKGNALGLYVQGSDSGDDQTSVNSNEPVYGSSNGLDGATNAPRSFGLGIEVTKSPDSTGFISTVGNETILEASTAPKNSTRIDVERTSPLKLIVPNYLKQTVRLPPVAQYASLPVKDRPVVPKNSSAPKEQRTTAMSPAQKAEADKVPNHVRIARARSTERQSPTKTSTGVDPLCGGMPKTALRSSMAPPPPMRRSSIAQGGHRSSKSVTIDDRRISEKSVSIDQQMTLPRSKTTSEIATKTLPQLPRPLQQVPSLTSKENTENKLSPSYQSLPNMTGAAENKENASESPVKPKWYSMRSTDSAPLTPSKSSGNIDAKSAKLSKSKSDKDNILAESKSEKYTLAVGDSEQAGSSKEKKTFLKGMWESMKNKTKPKPHVGSKYKEPYTVHSILPAIGFTPSCFIISCRPEYQSRLYGRLNMVLSTIVNRFLVEEYQSGRLSTAMAAAFVEKWVELGRAEVTEFNFGLPFQAKILWESRNNILFCGRYNRQIRDTILNQLLVDANAIALLTYCHGDSAIQKHLMDSWKVMELLGADWAEYESLSKIHISFHEQVAKEKAKNVQNGVEHPWNPPPIPKTPMLVSATRTPMLK